MKIAFVCGKGGVGKSTLCYLVALSLREAGKSVSLQDVDPQKSTSAWINRERDGITERGGNLTLIDTPPTLNHEGVLQAIREADRVIVPCSPSPACLTALGATSQVVLSLLKPGAKAFFALNMVVPRTHHTSDAPEFLNNLNFGIPLLNTMIVDRQCIQASVLRGWSALDDQAQGNFLKLSLEILS
jgi:cellulose biosynthesis protein BcsQ